MKARWMMEWASDGRMLLGTHVQPPLMSPEHLQSKHWKGNFTLAASIVVIMVLVIGAIFCCCYLWEGTLRIRTMASFRGQSVHTFPPDRLQSPYETGSNPPKAASLSVVMPGDSIPRFIAWASPQGLPADPTHPEPVATSHSPISRKSTPSPAVSLQMCIPS